MERADFSLCEALAGFALIVIMFLLAAYLQSMELAQY